LLFDRAMRRGPVQLRAGFVPSAGLRRRTWVRRRPAGPRRCRS